MLAPERIGHGICSIEDPGLVDHVRRRAIHLEACPSSNVQAARTALRLDGRAVARQYSRGAAARVRGRHGESAADVMVANDRPTSPILKTPPKETRFASRSVLAGI